MADLQPRQQRQAQQSTSPLTRFVRWLQLKKYQYDVTFSLYMLTPTEQIVFNSILFILISLLVTAAFFYLPDHLFIIYTRVWYYISGEFNGNGKTFSIIESIGDVLKTTKEVVVSQTASSAIAKETAGRMVGKALTEEL